LKKESDLKQKIYDQFLNRLIMTVLTGVAAGANLLAAVDYFLVATIPERSPWIIIPLAVFSLVCVIYWLVSFFKSAGIEGARGVAMFAGLLAAGSVSLGGYNIHKNMENTRHYYFGQEIQLRDMIATAEILADLLEDWRFTPHHSVTYVDEDLFFINVHNARGESFSQFAHGGDVDILTDIVVSLADGTSVTFSDDSIMRRLDTDNLNYVIHALRWVQAGNAELIRLSASPEAVRRELVPADGFPGTEYVIIIDGAQNIENFYVGIIGAEAAADVMLSFFGADTTLLYSVSIISTLDMSVSAAMSINGQHVLLWVMQEFLPVLDWNLDGDWYAYDFSDPETNEVLIAQAMINVTAMFEEYERNHIVRFGDAPEAPTRQDAADIVGDIEAQLREMFPGLDIGVEIND
jgi:hypothetical protein